tara:strand:+ start:1821 stop:2261 length:441 start_codon:yes stop_codon:yes gene_type:complete
MSDRFEVSMLLKLAVALFDEQIITLMRLDDDNNLFCISMPFELNLIEEEDAFLVSIELFPSDAKGYADRMKPFLEHYDGSIRWDIVESTDSTVMAYLRVSFDIDLAAAEIEGGFEELKTILADFFDQGINPFDHGDRTLNFMWLYR